jgi:RNA polymerase sigma factor (TIGR02999 family)
MSDATRLIEAAVAGDPKAAADLLPLIYDELRKLATARLAAEKPGQTLQATALVHEAYLRLVGSDPDQPWNGRGHFFAAAAEAMRRILVEQARRKGRVRHGGGVNRVELEDVPIVGDDDRADDLVALDGAVDALARVEPAKAEVVKLRYFAGLTIEETAACLEISPATAKRQWAVARAWLYRHVSSSAAASEESAGNP